jgi:hypothetical protein
MALGCVGGSKGKGSEDKEKLKPYILESPPPDIPLVGSLKTGRP